MPSALPPLATLDDAATYGYALTGAQGGALLARASARIRRAAQQSITPTTVVMSLEPTRDPRLFREMVTLPALPVTGVQTVMTDPWEGDPEVVAGWRWDGRETVSLPPFTGRVKVTWGRGFDPVPDGLIELCCEVASRLSQTPDGEGLVRQQAVDDYSVTFATEQIVAGGDLMPGELTALGRALGVPVVSMVKSRD